jgi:hypothetical protein
MAAEAAAYATEDWQAQLEEVLALHAIFAKDFRCVCVCGGGGGQRLLCCARMRSRAALWCVRCWHATRAVNMCAYAAS